MSRDVIREAIWQRQHPLWDRHADQRLRALGVNEPDRHTYLNAAADEFNVQRRRHLRYEAGNAVSMLAAAGIEPGQARRYLRAIRTLSPWDIPAATALICRCTAQGRVTYEDYIRLTVLLPVDADAPIDSEEVRAGRVTGRDLVWKLTT